MLRNATYSIGNRAMMCGGMMYMMMRTCESRR